MIKSLWLLIAITILSFSLHAQNLYREANALFKEGLYEKALEKYLELYKTEFENNDLNYQIGTCYLNTNANKGAAVPYLEFVAKQAKVYNYVYYDLGVAYHFARQFEKAIENFENFKALESKNNDLVLVADRKIQMCRNSINFMQNPLNITLINLGDRINTDKSEYLPFISDDESTIFYTTDKQFVYSYNVFVNNVYVSQNQSSWKKGKPINGRINTSEDEYIVGYNDALDKVLIKMYRYDVFDDIIIFDLKNNSAINEIYPGINVNSSAVESGACLSSEGDTIYFASNRPGGFGGLDIYYSMLLPTGEYGIPTNLGPTINTEFNEDYPNLANNGKTLYFASDGHETMGGYDIFYSSLNQTTKEWSKPKNLGYPLNDPYDNLSLSLSSDGRHGYISLNREGGLGEFDIYEVIFNDKDPSITLQKGQVFFLTPDTIPAQIIDSVIIITVKEQSTKTTIGEYAMNSKSGEYVMALLPGNYDLEITKAGIQPNKTTINILDKNISQNRILQMNLYIKKED